MSNANRIPKLAVCFTSSGSSVSPAFPFTNRPMKYSMVPPLFKKLRICRVLGISLALESRRASVNLLSEPFASSNVQYVDELTPCSRRPFGVARRSPTDQETTGRRSISWQTFAAVNLGWPNAAFPRSPSRLHAYRPGRGMSCEGHQANLARASAHVHRTMTFARPMPRRSRNSTMLAATSRLVTRAKSVQFVLILVGDFKTRAG